MARYSGNKSWNNIFITIYGLKNRSSSSVTMLKNADEGVKIYPSNLINAGYYITTPNRNETGYYWSNRIVAGQATKLYFRANYLHAGSGNPSDKGLGYSLRCVAKPIKLIKKVRIIPDWLLSVTSK